MGYFPTWCPAATVALKHLTAMIKRLRIGNISPSHKVSHTYKAESSKIIHLMKAASQFFTVVTSTLRPNSVFELFKPRTKAFLLLLSRLCSWMSRSEHFILQENTVQLLGIHRNKDTLLWGCNSQRVKKQTSGTVTLPQKIPFQISRCQKLWIYLP